MKKSMCYLVCLYTTINICAQNPIVPTGKYFSDPSAHVFSDGTMYIYGTRDEKQGKYCSTFYDILSTKDMKNWTFRENVFASAGENDQISYSDNQLYAPDCIEKDGKYYLYYCLAGGGHGVATSESPLGPFKKGELIKNTPQIDPSVFIDDDGIPYIFWGQFRAKMAKLNHDMKSIDMSTYKSDFINETKHHFHEGIQIIKRKNKYYLIYAHIGRRGRPTCLGYAMSDQISGPFKYKGVIIDNFGCDPYVWNNHGSIAEIDGQWYVFYHRSTEGGAFMRKACVEPIYFNEDGTIDEVEMTTQGAHGPLDPYKIMEAERACYLTGNVRVHKDGKGNEMLSEIRNLDTAAYKYFNFKKSPSKIKVEVTSINGGQIEIFANMLCRHLLARINVPKSDGKKLLILSNNISKKITGKNSIYIRFKGEKNKDLFNLESFVFE